MKISSYISVILCLLYCNTIIAQKQANNWYFGKNAAITFNTSTPSALSNSAMSTNEGVATISDTSGLLLFYTNGLTIYNRNHNAMSNGTGLLGDAISAQSAIIVPMPGNDSLYYVFTIPDWQNSSSNYFRYSIVDMKRSNGLGSVVVKNRLINTVSKEQITAVNHADGYRVWIITHEVGSNKFFSYLLSDTGLSVQAVVSPTGMRYAGNNRFGYLKSSHNGKLLCTTLGGGYSDTTIQLFDFNPNNGVVSNPRSLAWSGVQSSAYSCEFSYKDSFLYTASFNGADIYQYHLRSSNAATIRSTRTVISSGSNTKGCIQMGPDKKIYVCQSNTSDMAVIHAPDSLGSNSRFQNNYISLGGGRLARIGLPNFIQSFILDNDFNYSRNCINDTALFITVRKISDSVHWNFGDTLSGKLNFSNRKDSAKHIYKKPGKYIVRMISFLRTKRDTVIKEIEIKLVDPWIGFDTLYCNTPVFTKVLSSNRNYLEYKWSTGKKNKKDTITSPGKYILRVIDSSYCRLSDTVIISSVRTKARISASDTALCFRGNSFVFTDSSHSNDSIVSRNWYIGHVNVNSDTQIMYNFVKSGLHRLVLKVSSLRQCADSVVKIIKIHPQSFADFEINNDTQCYRFHDVSLNNRSQKNDVIRHDIWTFGDGSRDTSINISSKRFATDDEYDIKLTLVSQYGCIDSMSKKVWIMPEPKSFFKVNKDSMCFNQHLFSFEDSSYISRGNIISYKWMNDDGTNSLDQHQFEKRFVSEGLHKVSHIAYSEFTCTDTFDKFIRVWPSPNARFEINDDTQCFNGHAYNLTNVSVISNGTLTYKWDLSDTNEIATKDVSGKTYRQFGTYPINLVVSSGFECLDTAEAILQLYANPKATIYCDMPYQCFKGHGYDIENRSTIASGAEIKYDWDMGDGGTSNSKDIQNYIYKSEDSFHVKLICKSEYACSDSVFILLVTHPQPHAEVEIPNDSQCWQKHYFVLHNKSTLKYGNLNYLWDFGDNTSSTVSDPMDKRYPNRSAEYTLKLKLKSDFNCLDSISKRIVLLERPIADFTINDSQQCLNDNLFKFKNSSTFSAMNTLTYGWEKGDGNGNLGEMTPDHVYSDFGKYQCRLLVHSSLNNCADTVMREVVVAPKPVADFSIEKDSQCFKGNFFKFENKSTSLYGDLKFHWNAEDGNQSNDSNTFAKYLDTGAYDVKLKVESEFGCSDSVIKSVHVMPHPLANFTIDDTAQCENSHKFNMLNTSEVSYGDFHSVWETEDGVYRDMKDLLDVEFKRSGYMNIQLSVMSDFGCTDTFLREVYLEQSGGTDIIFTSNDSQCLRGNIFEMNLKEPSMPKQIKTVNWEMGDGFNNIGKSVKYSYLDTGFYSILMQTISENGCIDTSFGKVLIHPHPHSQFTASSPCFPEAVDFKNLSKISSGEIVAYQWEFGDGGTSNLIDVVRNFASAGTYSAKLFCESSFGCRDTMFDANAVIVRERPSAQFDILRLSDNSDGDIVLNLIDASKGDIVSYKWESYSAVSTEKNPIFKFSDSGRFKFRLMVTNSESCSDTIEMLSMLMYPKFRIHVPTAFSPNEDAHNNYYNPVFKGYVRKYRMEIFNSWGEKLFDSTDPSMKWDGTYMGNPCPQGVYLCRIFVVPHNGEIAQYATTFTLLR